MPVQRMQQTQQIVTVIHLAAIPVVMHQLAKNMDTVPVTTRHQRIAAQRQMERQIEVQVNLLELKLEK